MLQQYMPSFLFCFVDMMHNILLNAASRHHHAVFHLTALLIAEREFKVLKGWCIKLKVELCEQLTTLILPMICAVFL
jgi:hypothetical protein